MPLAGRPDGVEGTRRQIEPMLLEMRDAIRVPQKMKAATKPESRRNGTGARAYPLTQVEARPGRNPPMRRMISDTHRIGLLNSSARCAPLISGNASSHTVAPTVAK